jgi:hypothetical protein
MRASKRPSTSYLKRYFPQTRQLLSQVASSLGLTSSRRERTVRFQPSAAVYEFERQLLGGGGVPDGDTVALGLGPRCVRRWKSRLAGHAP